ncbi:MAG: C40 family peptidase [Melioribacteraceae bacterium]|nr:C40 family peptidase [Melioribacteraceae bacterium]
MLKKLTSLLLFLFSFSVNAQINNSVTEIINNTGKEFAPDKRVAVFEVNYSEENSLRITGKTDNPEAKQKLIDRLNMISDEFEYDIEILPSKDLGEEIYGVVNLSVANIRTNPEHSAELTTQALLGTPVKVLEYSKGFFRIQTPDEYIAWVDGSGIYRFNKTDFDNWMNSDKIIYTNDFGFSYTDKAFGARVSDLVMGDILRYIDEDSNTYKVAYPDGRIAFISKENGMPLEKWYGKLDLSEDSIVNTAKQFMGVPYLWGGTSAKGMDCSGFTKTIYFMNGIVLPRDASQQVYTGEIVDTEKGFENLRKGDLLFFGRKTEEGRKERITHVALYIGNGEYIHASGMVKINSLDKDKPNFNQYRFNSFIRAKRILSSISQNGIFKILDNKFYAGEF